MQVILSFIFRLYDAITGWFAQNLRFIKIGILLIAHLSLLGFFFPESRKAFGEMAGNLLIGILFISPLSRIFRMRLLLLIMSIRRELGILMAYLATVHGVGYMIDPAWFQSEIVPLYGEWQNGYLFGILAYTLTLPLLLTSNAFALKHLGGATWKLVHRIVYAMFIFAMLHRFFIKVGFDGNITFAFLEAGIVIGVYAGLQLLAYKNFLPPLKNVILWVSTSYKQYQEQNRAKKAV
jgi:DMSO/TMAO reductase YedYZ heme-binding membrane subunit